MQPIFYVIAIMGCGDGAQACQQQRVEPIHYVSPAACQAAMPAALERNTDIDAPEIQGACRSSGLIMAREQNKGSQKG